MHNIDKPWIIIVRIKLYKYWYVYIVYIRYIIIIWKGWFHFNVEIYKYHGQNWGELVYMLWLDITPYHWIPFFMFIGTVYYIYKVIKEPYRLDIWLRPIYRFRPANWRYERAKFYKKYIRYYYIKYTGYRYNFFDNIDKLLNFCYYFFTKVKKMKLNLKNKLINKKGSSSCPNNKENSKKNNDRDNDKNSDN